MDRQQHAILSQKGSLYTSKDYGQYSKHCLWWCKCFNVYSDRARAKPRVTLGSIYILEAIVIIITPLSLFFLHISSILKQSEFGVVRDIRCIPDDSSENLQTFLSIAYTSARASMRRNPTDLIDERCICPLVTPLNHFPVKILIESQKNISSQAANPPARHNSIPLPPKRPYISPFYLSITPNPEISHP